MRMSREGTCETTRCPVDTAGKISIWWPGHPSAGRHLCGRIRASARQCGALVSHGREARRKITGPRRCTVTVNQIQWLKEYKQWAMMSTHFFSIKMVFLKVREMSLMVQCQRLCTCNAGGLDSAPGQGIRSHVLQLRVRMPLKVCMLTKRSCMPQQRSKIPSVATKARRSQINKEILF